jgi:glutathionylspermidine synthase
MVRHTISPRINWQSKVEELGFGFHSAGDSHYWDESTWYEFNYAQIDVLEKTSNKLHRMCLKAVDHVIRENLFPLFCIPDSFVKLIKTSWQRETPSIYGRFDLSWNGDVQSPPKMLEYNADTPTSLFEAAVVQWYWQQEVLPGKDQFNSMHEKLLYWWKQIKPRLNGEGLHLACLDEFPEDLVTLKYMQDCARQAGISTTFCSIPDIGWDGSTFRDTAEQEIKHIFKLYPWEWLMHEEFGEHMHQAQTEWIEPPWKMILSNKAILPILWQLFPNHPNLLECYFNSPGPLQAYVSKPLLSREGANIRIVEEGTVHSETGGEYGEEGFVYQALHKLPCFHGNYPVIGSWIIGGKAAGMGIRESRSPITDNLSRFVPHAIVERKKICKRN